MPGHQPNDTPIYPSSLPGLAHPPRSSHPPSPSLELLSTLGNTNTSLATARSSLIHLVLQSGRQEIQSQFPMISSSSPSRFSFSFSSSSSSSSCDVSESVGRPESVALPESPTLGPGSAVNGFSVPAFGLGGGSGLGDGDVDCTRDSRNSLVDPARYVQQDRIVSASMGGANARVNRNGGFWEEISRGSEGFQGEVGEMEDGLSRMRSWGKGKRKRCKGLYKKVKSGAKIVAAAVKLLKPKLKKEEVVGRWGDEVEVNEGEIDAVTVTMRHRDSDSEEERGAGRVSTVETLLPQQADEQKDAVSQPAQDPSLAVESTQSEGREETKAGEGEVFDAARSSTAEPAASDLYCESLCRPSWEPPARVSREHADKSASGLAAPFQSVLAQALPLTPGGVSIAPSSQEAAPATTDIERRRSRFSLPRLAKEYVRPPRPAPPPPLIVEEVINTRLPKLRPGAPKQRASLPINWVVQSLNGTTPRTRKRPAHARGSIQSQNKVRIGFDQVTRKPSKAPVRASAVPMPPQKPTRLPWPITPPRSIMPVKPAPPVWLAPPAKPIVNGSVDKGKGRIDSVASPQRSGAPAARDSQASRLQVSRSRHRTTHNRPIPFGHPALSGPKPAAVLDKPLPSIPSRVARSMVSSASRPQSLVSPQPSTHHTLPRATAQASPVNVRSRPSSRMTRLLGPSTANVRTDPGPRRSISRQPLFGPHGLPKPKPSPPATKNKVAGSVSRTSNPRVPLQQAHRVRPEEWPLQPFVESAPASHAPTPLQSPTSPTSPPPSRDSLIPRPKWRRSIVFSSRKYTSLPTRMSNRSSMVSMVSSDWPLNKPRPYHTTPGRLNRPRSGQWLAENLEDMIAVDRLNDPISETEMAAFERSDSSETFVSAECGGEDLSRHEEDVERGINDAATNTDDTVGYGVDGHDERRRSPEEYTARMPGSWVESLRDSR